MQETKITGNRIRNHFTYSWWKYMLLAIVAVVGWSLIYSSTGYRAPKDKRLDVTFVTYALSSDFTDGLKTEILEKYPQVEDSSVVSITYTADDNYYGSMQLMTYTAAGEGDVYIMTRERFEVFAQQGLFEPLDEAIESGALDLRGIDVSKCVIKTEEGITGVMGIPATSLYGFMGDGVDNRDLVMSVAVYSQNKETAVDFIGWLIETKEAPKPDWLVQQEEKDEAVTGGVSDIPSY